ncbi:MAG: tripartite tricarboxylate transporter permease [Deltaproteobacteria bacterium]|nr:tripartite tricarboxylate transporter permease [Deltaproteobacteria bacterium]
MDLFQNILFGFQVALQPINLLYCFIGVFIGTLIGVLPGIGPVGTMAILFPITFKIAPVTAIIMLAGIYYGAMYGGSTTSILVNIPGEAAAVVTCLDGYQMARQGRAGPALGIAAFGSFIAGTLSLVGLMLLTIPLAEAALKFGPPEYFAIMTLGLTLVTYLARQSMIKALAMAVLGLMLSFIGLDLITGEPRFTYNIPELLDGIGVVPLVVGVFGISEVLVNVEIEVQRSTYQARISNLLPTLQDWKDSAKPILRGSLLGFLIGILPGAGSILASFSSYALEKRCSRTPEKFGTGMIEGVAGPESANNSAVSGGFIPLFTLGIPSNAIMALLLGAMLVHGLQPGPMLLSEHPAIFWGVVASMYVGNFMLLALNLPLIGLWVQVLKVPYRILFPLILLFCLIGSYSLNNSTVDVLIMIIFGIVGYFMRKFGYEGAPMVMAFILGPMWESALRQSLLMSKGRFSIFLNRPISLVAFILTLALLLSPTLSFIREKKKVLKVLEKEE